MKIEYDDEIKATYALFEKWARANSEIKTWSETLDLDSQDQLKLFAKFQSFVLKSFMIIRNLKKEHRWKVLTETGSKRLASRWLIWSNTCMEYNFIPS